MEDGTITYIFPTLILSRMYRYLLFIQKKSMFGAVKAFSNLVIRPAQAL